MYESSTYVSQQMLVNILCKFHIYKSSLIYVSSIYVRSIYVCSINVSQ